MGKKSCLSLILAASVILSGCSSNGSVFATQRPWYLVPMAVPLQSTTQQEVTLARIDQILTRSDLTNDERAQLYYERGLVNDSLGLQDLARLDFHRSLSINPAQADVFNILGIYFTQTEMYDAAYEAFDSSLELNTAHDHARRNRGIALYYGGRYKLALRDLQAHYRQDPTDAYRLLWLYLAEQKYHGTQQAQQLLQQRANKLGHYDDWSLQIIKLYLDQISEQEFFAEAVKISADNAQLAERLCEGYFYLAKQYQAQGDVQNAVALYKLALATNVHDFVEHRYATLELSKIAEQYRLAASKAL